MNRKAKVVITDHFGMDCDFELSILSDCARVITLQSNRSVDFLSHARDCDALINFLSGPIDEDIIANMPRCKIIARYGIGVDTVDLEAATKAGVIVTNNPDYCLEEVADHAIALILSLARRITQLDRQVRDGGWSIGGGRISRLSGRTLGLVGYGRIARLVAHRARAFGMCVVFFDPHVQSDPEGLSEKLGLKDVLLASDVVSIHAPLTTGTHGIIDADALSCMKPDAMLINVSRGPLVDTDALVSALERGALSGCALDTVDPEPLPAGHFLRDRDDVIITPHSAWYSNEALKLLRQGAPSAVRSVLAGEWPKNVVNPSVRHINRAGIA